MFGFTKKKAWNNKKYTLTMILDGQETFKVDLSEKLNEHKIENWIRCSKKIKKRIILSIDKVQVLLPFADAIITFNLNTLGYVKKVSIWFTGYDSSPFSHSFNFADLNGASNIILRLDNEVFSVYDIINMANMLGMREGYKLDGSYFTVNTHDGVIIHSLRINFDSTEKWLDMIDQKAQHRK